MNTLVKKSENIFASKVWFSEAMLHVQLADGREVGVPLDWFPKLRDASETDRNTWRFIGKGQGIHWENLDEDLSVARLLD
ncbi:MAG: DUF2442 domain-containing protein [Bacteroidetes bacterium]|nr:MAG: DUF2442 domain-containing protein [Bacteroidota bacterium]